MPLPVKLEYPKEKSPLDTALTQELLDLTTAHVLSWQQGAGNFGALHLHACWGNSSVLHRRYQGQTVPKCGNFLGGMMDLYDYTGDKRWLWHAEDIVTNTLSLQAENGGFYHASNENEPTYTPERTCPIAQGLGVRTLQHYLKWSSASPRLTDRVQYGIKKHFDWFVKKWWQLGNKWSGQIPAGFCGVTNQDLVVVTALAQYAVQSGDDTYYQQYGVPTLDMLLSPKYYHEAIGLFERGDKPNFVERTGYHLIVLNTLENIYKLMGDERLPKVISNVRERMFETVYEAKDGRHYVAWGADTDPDDKSHITGWTRLPCIIGESIGVANQLDKHLEENPDKERAQLVTGLLESAASYIQADGTLPITFGNNEPLFSVVGNYNALWRASMKHLGSKAKSPTLKPLPCVNRSSGPVTWKHNQTMWSIEVDGVRRFAGFKANPGGIAIGPDDTVAEADFAELDTPDIIEIITPPF